MRNNYAYMDARSVIAYSFDQAIMSSSAIGGCDVRRLAWFVGVSANFLDPVQEMRSDESGGKLTCLALRVFLVSQAIGMGMMDNW